MFPINCGNNVIYNLDESLLYLEGEDLLFTCRDNNGQLFLGQSLSDSTVMLVPILASKVSELKCQLISLNEAFTQANAAIYIDVTEVPMESILVPMSDVPISDLPLGGQMLYSSNCEFERGLSALAEEAASIQQDKIELHLEPSDKLNRINLSVFLKILLEIKGMTDYLVEKMTSPLRQDFDEYTDGFYLLPSTTGSYTVNLISPTQNNLFKETGYELACNRFLDMLDCRDLSMSAYFNMPHDVIENVKGMMYALKKYNFTYSVYYANHKRNMMTLSCNSEMIEKKYKSLTCLASEAIDEVNYSGIFYCVNMKLRRFYFRRLDNSAEMSGPIEKSVICPELSDPKRVETYKIYTSTFKRTSRKYSSGEPVVLYELINVSLVKDTAETLLNMI